MQSINIITPRVVRIISLTQYSTPGTGPLLVPRNSEDNRETPKKKLWKGALCFDDCSHCRGRRVLKLTKPLRCSCKTIVPRNVFRPKQLLPLPRVIRSLDTNKLAEFRMIPCFRHPRCPENEDRAHNLNCPRRESLPIVFFDSCHLDAVPRLSLSSYFPGGFLATGLHNCNGIEVLLRHETSWVVRGIPVLCTPRCGPL